MNVVIFGKGKVGEATAHALNVACDWVDPRLGYDVTDLSVYDIAIICVSSLENGPYDHAAIDQCLWRLKEADFKGIVAVRCTVSPEWMLSGAPRVLNSLNVIHFPEFMKQHGDHINDKPWVVVLGGPKEHVDRFGDWLIARGYGDQEMQLKVDLVQSAIIKLGENGFLATKVAYFNMIYQLCKKYRVDYGPVRDGIAVDDRINFKHTDVPGWDGKLGYGGHCLPKDTRCLAAIDRSTIMASVITFNGWVRNEDVSIK